MKTQIIFLIDPSSLTDSSGTFEAPVGVSHPNMLVIQDGGTPTQHDGDYKVLVPKGERIQIWLEDVGRRPNVLIAPVRLVANQWNNENLSLSQVNGPDTPIGRPNYMVNHEDEYGFVYTGAQTEWQTDDIPAITHWGFKGVEAGRDGQTECPRVHSPYVTFNMTDYSGLLWYGLEFALTVSGQFKGYYFFDPYIQVR